MSRQTHRDTPVFRQRRRPTFTAARRERRGMMHKISHAQADTIARKQDDRTKSTSGKNESLPCSCRRCTWQHRCTGRPGSFTLLHHPLHRRQNLSTSQLCPQGLPAVEVVRHQYSRAPRVAARRLAAAAILRRLIAALACHSVRTVGQVRRLARRALPPRAQVPPFRHGELAQTSSSQEPHAGGHAARAVSSRGGRHHATSARALSRLLACAHAPIVPSTYSTSTQSIRSPGRF